MSSPQTHWSASSTLLPSPTSPNFLSDSWEKAHYLSLTLWDIDREFQKSNEAYEQWLVKNKRKRSISRFQCFREGKWDDEVGKVLCLGRQVREALERGMEKFGSKFEQGDSTCTAILSAQLLRVQHEIRVPLEDCALARFSMTIPRDDILSAAKGVRRTCLQALRDQLTRLQSPSTMPFLPLPRFSVNFCPFALQLQKDGRKASFQTLKVKRHDKHDDREICTYCNAQIATAMHTGLPAYRWILFSSHLLEPPTQAVRTTTFACTGCNKTFSDSYGFLDHVFQKEIGSERSCQHSWGSQLGLNRATAAESDPVLVEKCLRNCLKRELTRAKTLRKSKAFESDGQYGLDLATRPLTSAGTFRKRPTLASLSEDSASTLYGSVDGASSASSNYSNSIRPMTSSGTLTLRDRERPTLRPLASLSEDSTTTLVETESVGSPRSFQKSFQDEWGMSAKLYAQDSILNRGRPVSDTPFFHTRSTRSSFRRRWLQEVA